MVSRVVFPGRLNVTNIGRGGSLIGSSFYSNDAQETFMTLTSKSVGTVTLFYSPKETQHSGLSSQWEEIPRAGQPPIVVPSGQTSERMSFECTMAATQPRNIVAELQGLRNMARSKDPISISYTDWEGRGFWRISDMSVDIRQRSSLDHSPTLASISLELISLAGGTAASTGMLTGGAPTDNSNFVPTSGVRRYTVKAGDTLWSIAEDFYGNGELGRTLIATANKLTRPKVQLTVGRVLKIPSLI